MTVLHVAGLIATAMFCMWKSAAAVRKPSAILWLIAAVFLLLIATRGNIAP